MTNSPNEEREHSLAELKGAKDRMTKSSQELARDVMAKARVRYRRREVRRGLTLSLGVGLLLLGTLAGMLRSTTVDLQQATAEALLGESP